MSETITVDDLTQRAKAYLEIWYEGQSSALIRDLSAALVQAEQAREELKRIARELGASVERLASALEEAEAKLVQAEQEKAALKEKLDDARFDRAETLRMRAGAVHVFYDTGDPYLNKIATHLIIDNAGLESIVAARLASQATIRQVEQEMGLDSRPDVKRWADTLRAILPAEETGEKQ